MGFGVFTVVLVVLGIIALFILLYYIPVGLWITAQVTNVRVGLFELFFMRIRKVPPSIIVNSLITATKAGLKINEGRWWRARRDLKTQDLETHYLAGGNVPLVIKALISAEKANIDLTFKQATAIDLAG